VLTITLALTLTHPYYPLLTLGKEPVANLIGRVCGNKVRGLYKRFVCLFLERALVQSIMSPKRLLYFAPLYFAHKLYRAMYGSRPTPLLC